MINLLQTSNYTPLILKFSIKKKRKKPLLVPIFLGDFHFSPEVLFLPLLVPILENASILVPAVTSEIEKADVANGRNK